MIPHVELDGMPEEQYSIQDKMDEIINELSKVPQVKFGLLFAGLSSRKAVVISFLAVLELVRMQKILVRQDRTFGEIIIARWEEKT